MFGKRSQKLRRALFKFVNRHAKRAAIPQTHLYPGAVARQNDRTGRQGRNQSVTPPFPAKEFRPRQSRLIVQPGQHKTLLIHAHPRKACRRTDTQQQK
jgi:hypothetical protein